MSLRMRLYFGAFFVVIIASLFGPTLATAQRVVAALNDPAVVRRYQQFITADGLASRLYFLASDFFEGRETATRGQKMAAHYLASEYRQLGLTPFGTEKTNDPLSAYFQPFTVYRRTPRQSRLEVAINGRQVASSMFSADSHDDLSFFYTGAVSGATGEVVFGGLGVAANYEELSAKGIKLEDKWLLILDDDQFIKGQEINMDGVGGIDAKHPTQSKNYIYILGTEELSSELIDATKRLNTATGVNLELTPNKGFPSDQMNFEAQFVPYIYYSTGLTEKYHQTSDEPNTIDYDHFARVVRLIFATAWQAANQDTRIRNIDRTQLTLAGYVCRPCPFACDEHVYDHPGECPVCGMGLVPKYKRS